MKSFDLTLPDELATAAWSARLATALTYEPLAEQPFVLHLSGELGAGKTALARALLRAFGFPGAVKSPSFALVEPYNLPNFNVYHFDLYRFFSSDQWFDAGFDDILAAPGLMLLEWPEKAAGALADPDLLLRLEVTGPEDERALHARAFSEAGRQCLSRLARGGPTAAGSPPSAPQPPSPLLLPLPPGAGGGS